jgi:hypothetical protein
LKTGTTTTKSGAAATAAVGPSIERSGCGFPETGSTRPVPEAGWEGGREVGEDRDTV